MPWLEIAVALVLAVLVPRIVPLGLMLAVVLVVLLLGRLLELGRGNVQVGGRVSIGHRLVVGILELLGCCLCRCATARRQLESNLRATHCRRVSVRRWERDVLSDARSAVLRHEVARKDQKNVAPPRNEGSRLEERERGRLGERGRSN
jgi:hypothetical protein